MPTIQEILQTMDYGPAPESTKEAHAWLDQHQRRFGLFIDNAWSAPSETFASNNPADAKELAQLTANGADEHHVHIIPDDEVRPPPPAPIKQDTTA